LRRFLVGLKGLLLPRLNEIIGEIKALNSRVNSLENRIDSLEKMLDERLVSLRNEMLARF